jgi:hypothetical protein
LGGPIGRPDLARIDQTVGADRVVDLRLARVERPNLSPSRSPAANNTFIFTYLKLLQDSLLAADAIEREYPANGLVFIITLSIFIPET